MIKRILSVVICVLMVAAVCAVSASAAGNVELKVSTDVTNANPGDVLDYQVAMAPTSVGVGSIQFQIVIPEGMTFVGGSVIDKEALGFDAFDFTATSMMVNGYASAADYTSESATVLANFQLKVNDDAAGNLSVTLTNVEMGSCETFEVYDTAVMSSSVFVDGGTPVEPTVAPTKAPETVAPTKAPETVAPTQKGTEKSTEKATTVAPTQKSTTKATSDSTTAKKDSTSPKTSDNGMIFVWIGLFALAVLGVAGTFVYKKVRK